MVDEREEILKQLGTTLKNIRIENGYTREQLSERAGISTRHLIAIENEMKRPRYEVLYMLIHALGVSADRIFYSSESNRDDAEQIKNLYLRCSERDQKIIKSLIDCMLNEA